MTAFNMDWMRRKKKEAISGGGINETDGIFDGEEIYDARVTDDENDKKLVEPPDDAL